MQCLFRRTILFILAAAVLQSGCVPGNLFNPFPLRTTNSPKLMQPSPTPLSSSRFQVFANRIYDPANRPVILRGVVLPYGYFFGSQGSTNRAFDKYGWGQLNLKTAGRDFAAARGLGVNLVRVMVTYADGANETDRAKLERIVAMARKEGMIVEIAGGDAFHENAEIPVDGAPSWIFWLARRWKDDPYVWIQPVNEPNCDFANHLCEDWDNWQKEHQAYIDQIRAAGNTAPIVVNTIRWSWDLSKIADYPLTDPLSNIIYGAHRYANCTSDWPPSDALRADQDWGDQSAHFALIVDETGAYNGEQECGSSYHNAWNRGFLDYVGNWIEKRGGNGATGFAWYWSDDNSLTGDWREFEYGNNDLPYGRSDAVLNEWGQTFRDHFLARFDDRANLAPAGQPMAWSFLPVENNLSAGQPDPAPMLTDLDLSTDLELPDPGGHAYQAAGLIWDNPVAISTVNFVQGSFTAPNGLFAGDLHLQISLDGKTWRLSDWGLLQDYPRNARAEGATFTFTGAAVTVGGVRIVGAVNLGENSSAFIRLREVQVY